MDNARAVNPCTQDFDILELGVFHVLIEHFPIGVRGCTGIGHHEGQFKDFGRRETTGCIGDNGPNDVCNAIDGLVHQLWWLTAQLHRRKTVNGDFPTRGRFDLVSPDIQDQLWHIGLCWQKLVQFQGDVFGKCRSGAEGDDGGGAGSSKKLSTSGHMIPPF